MNMKFRFVFHLVFAVALLPAAASGESVPDTVYLQEIGRKIVTPDPLRAVAVFDRNVYVGSEKGLSLLTNNHLNPVSALNFVRNLGEVGGGCGS